MIWNTNYLDIGDHDENEKSPNYDGDAAYIGRVVHEEGRGSLMGVHWTGRADLKGSMGGVGLLISYGGDFKGGAVRANMGHVRRIK